ncbi:MAG TPA: hypothetical protein VK619_07175 [Pyrinomonadaceae bacterium]|nr:hypothetical protein [Pyrinomonadaceae bacterium]
MRDNVNSPAGKSRIRRLKLTFVALFLLFALSIFYTGFNRVAASRPTGQVPTPGGFGPQAGNQAPEMASVRFTRVGVGQRITFGISVIDEESDDVRVELVQKPASARYNERTLTVDWTPQVTDGRSGDFAVRITEFARDTGDVRRTLLKSFSIKIEAQPVTLPTPQPGSLAVETLVSITDTERLAAANQRWPIVALFDRIAQIEASKQITTGSNIKPTTGAALFRDALKNLAALHHNEEIDPDSPRFNQQWNAENWRLVMVRPRMNKKVFELRMVYRNVVAAEPVYLMPRMRIVRGKDAGRPDEVRQKNNQTFARLFHDAFFDGANLKPFVASDRQKYGEALSDFITKVVTYNDPADPNMQANFAALPHNARLGGDDALDAQGKYLRGNGWALGVMKVVPVERGGARVLAFANLPIDGFATSIKPNPAGTAYAPFPAPRFNPSSPAFIKGWDRLIDVDDHANVAIPDEHDGNSSDAPSPSSIDASSLSRGFKSKLMVEETSLRDPRRRLFEERGMTCIQCHVRNFDEGDYLDAAVSDPKQLAKMTATRDIPRLFFVITPDEERSEFFRRNEEEQVGNLQGVMRDYLGIKINIPPALAADWPFNTKTGRS